MNGSTRDPEVADDLRARLADVYWIGGGSGAGKTTVARRRADANGFPLYSTDDVMPDHARRCPPGDCPELTRSPGRTSS